MHKTLMMLLTAILLWNGESVGAKVEGVGMLLTGVTISKVHPSTSTPWTSSLGVLGLEELQTTGLAEIKNLGG